MTQHRLFWRDVEKDVPRILEAGERNNRQLVTRLAEDLLERAEKNLQSSHGDQKQAYKTFIKEMKQYLIKSAWAERLREREKAQVTPRVTEAKVGSQMSVDKKGAGVVQANTKELLGLGIRDVRSPTSDSKNKFDNTAIAPEKNTPTPKNELDNTAKSCDSPFSIKDFMIEAEAKKEATLDDLIKEVETLIEEARQ